jgi:hypothetical protein
MKSTSSIRQSGAVSIFVVVFAVLLMSVVTISFLRIMTNDQSQAANNDLSLSAYDSALAGVEDAKRALAKYQAICISSPSDCATWKTNLSSSQCNRGIIYSAVVGSGVGSGEVKIQQSTTSGDQALDQAYTCVTMKLDTDDYVGEVAQNESQLIPLVGQDGQTVSQVQIQWFSKENVSNEEGTVTVGSVAAPKPLPQQNTSVNNWNVNAPPVLRTQFMQTAANEITLTDFDVMEGTNSNSNTLFLYPSTNGGTTGAFVGRDVRSQKNNPEPQPKDDAVDTPLLARCDAKVSSGNYSCTMTLTIPEPIGAGGRGTAFLRLTPFYNKADFKVTLRNSAGGVINFNGVQPEVDATGRANNVYRRVGARVNLYDTSFPYPDATVDVGSNFCKDFGVTDDAYIAGECNP